MSSDRPDPKTLEYMQIPDDHEILFYARAAMKKLLHRQEGHVVVSSDGRQAGRFTWQANPGAPGLLHLGANTRDVYRIQSKGKTLSFSSGRVYRFVFETEAQSRECCDILKSVQEEITKSRG